MNEEVLVENSSLAVVQFSIITINYNNKLGLEKTIKSVLSQVNIDYDYWVIDGGSTDGSLEVMQSHSPNINWLSEKDSGIYNAMNKGIVKATGCYLMFLNSGDCLNHPTALYECHKVLSARPSIDILYGDVYTSDANNTKFKAKWSYPAKVNLAFFKASTINHQSCLIKADLFKKLGFYSEQHGIAADYLFFLKCIINNNIFIHIDSALVVYDITGISAIDNYKSYTFAMQKIWKALIPLWVQEIVDDNNMLNHQIEPRIVKMAIYLNELLRKIK